MLADAHAHKHKIDDDDEPDTFINELLTEQSLSDDNDGDVNGERLLHYPLSPPSKSPQPSKSLVSLLEPHAL